MHVVSDVSISTSTFEPRRYATLAHIEQLDPLRDDEQIARLLVTCEFPFDVLRATELAVIRTFGIPAIAKVLVKTGKFLEKPAQRKADTELLIRALVREGYRGAQGQKTLAAIREAHRRLPSDTDEMRYVLGTFVFEPVRWLERFGWRPMSQREAQGAFTFWRNVGEELGISVPDTLEEFRTFYEDFERQEMVFDPANQALAIAVREDFMRPVPRPFKPLGRHMMHALIDERLRTACGLPAAPKFLQAALEKALRARGSLASKLCRGRTPFLL